MSAILLGKPDFVTLASSQEGVFSSQQAADHGISRAYLSKYAKKGLFERLVQGIYRISILPEPEHPDIMIAGLKGVGMICISDLTALGFHGIGQEVAYSAYSHVLPDVNERRLRGLKSMGVQVDQSGPAIDINGDCWSYGDVLVTTPQRTVFDCVRNHLLQIETIEDLIDQGLFSPDNLRDELKTAWSEMGITEIIESRVTNNMNECEPGL